MPRTKIPRVAVTRLLAVAGVAAAAVLAAVPGSARAAHDPRPTAAGSGHVVPGLTGQAALTAGATVGEHFRKIREGRVPAATLHADWGMFPTSPPVGAMATQSINPNVKLSATGDETLYTPTMLPGRDSCIELSTIYTATAVEIGAWDWCADAPNFLKLAVADATFMSTYTTTVNALKAYTARVVRTDAATNTWTASLYNQRTQAWDTFYTSSGTTKLTTSWQGWDAWEIYSNTNSSTGTGYYCTEARGTTFESSSLMFTFNGIDWKAARPVNSEQVGPDGSYNCPSLVFLVPTANSDFTTTVPKAEPAWPTVRSGDTGNRVKTVQYLLNAQQNAGLTVDGDFGAKTLAAVKAFQSSRGMNADGIVGVNTWSQLTYPVVYGDTGDAVKAVQNELTAHGVTTAVTGTYDSTTHVNARQFQVNSGIAPRGDTDLATWRFLVQ
ncbi:MAG: peptidoglycan-binding protein [Mycobacteriales bacterium]